MSRFLIDRYTAPMRDDVDELAEAWARERPDLDLAPVAVFSRISRLARHLDVPARSAVMAFDRRGSTGGRPLERAVSHYRGDRYSLHVSLDSTMPHHHRKDTR
jgi:hypothetical protein